MGTAALVCLILVGLIVLMLGVQFFNNYTVVGANQVVVVAGRGKDGFKAYHGGRVAVWPLVNKRYDLDLRPTTTPVHVQAAVARGMIPLDVIATISFAVSSSGLVLQNAIRRILWLSGDRERLTAIVSMVIEGHLRDSIATMTPEQVMTDKDRLVRNMISACKADLEAIGLEITTMNIADVEDHRLDGMKNGDLYIALLNRTESATALSQAKITEAEAQAAAKEKAEARRGDVETRRRDNERESLESETNAKLADINQDGAVRSENEKRSGAAELDGVKANIDAETKRIDYLKMQFDAELLTPAHAKATAMRLEAKAEAAKFKGGLSAQLDQLELTAKTLKEGGPGAIQAYLMANSDAFVEPFARTLDLFSANEVSVISGLGKNAYSPISAVDPHPVERFRSKVFEDAIGQDESRSQGSESNRGDEDHVTRQAEHVPVKRRRVN